MSNTSSKKKSSNKLAYYVKAPYRLLISARDLYVSSLGGCAGRVQQGGVIAARVPRSQSHGFRNSTTGDDINELIRAASQGRLGPLDAAMQRDPVDAGGAAVVPRSQSVGVGTKRPPMMMMIGRIEEEDPNDISGSNRRDVMYPRSRSAAVISKGKVSL